MDLPDREAAAANGRTDIVMPDPYCGLCAKAHPGQVNEKWPSNQSAVTRRLSCKAGMAERD